MQRWRRLAKKGDSSVATSSEYAAPDGAKSKSTTAGYKDAAPDGAAAKDAALSRDAIAKIDTVAAAAREVRGVRAEALRNLKGGLRALYRTLEWTRSRPLARPSRAFCFANFLSPYPKRAQVSDANPLIYAHAALDAAVLAAYDFSAADETAETPADASGLRRAAQAA